MSEPLPPRATYLLPLRMADAAEVEELATYLGSLDVHEVLVVDASEEQVFAALHQRIAGAARHVRPDPRIAGSNGKVRGVLTGLALSTCERIVIADDDVRYDASSLAAVLDRLNGCDVVRPQNYFSPSPWHAVYDSARSLINRAFDGDWPGTLALHRSALPGGYDADVLFENYELVQTVRRNGGTACVAAELFVRRLPPSTSHFLGQRVRQAYDEFARPLRMVAALAIVPALLLSAACRQPAFFVAIVLAAISAATAGWLRDGAYRYFSPLAVLCAPLWVLERGICAWLALYQRVRYGGVRYGGTVVRRAASRKEGRMRWAA